MAELADRRPAPAPADRGIRQQPDHSGLSGNHFPSQAVLLRIVSAVVIVVFFSVYTASGLVGGSCCQRLWRRLHDRRLVTLGVVLVYTVAGRFLAVSLTDFVQGCIMMLGAGDHAHSHPGPRRAAPVSIRRPARLTAVDPEYLSMFRASPCWLDLGGGLGSGLFRSAAYHRALHGGAASGRADRPPHRHELDDRLADRARWPSASSDAYAERDRLQVTDPETIFIMLSDLLFHPLVTGFPLCRAAGCDHVHGVSQLLVASSSLTEDIYLTVFSAARPSVSWSMSAGLAVLAVGAVAVLLASNPDPEILGLVANAWAGFWRRLRSADHSGADLEADDRRRCRGRSGHRRVVVILWIALGLSSTIYEIVRASSPRGSPSWWSA